MSIERNKILSYPSFANNEMENAMNIERIKDVLSYNPDTGEFTWKKQTAKHDRTGKRAGSFDHRGYLIINLDKGDLLGQRVAWILMNGEIPPGRLYFRDKNPSNLKWSNLALNRGIKGYDSGTPEGRSAYGKAWRAANVSKAKDYDLKKKFGISIRQYEDMFLAQHGKCAICDQRETSKRNGNKMSLCVDHNHKTGAIRALLCRGCNQGIGNFLENPELLKKAISYIEQHNESNVIPLISEIKHD